MNALNTLEERLLERFAPGRIARDVPLSGWTTLRVGGPADLFLSVQSPEDVRFALLACAQCGVPFLLLGNGSNLLVRDGGFRGLALHMGKAYSNIAVQGNRLLAQSGAPLSALAKLAAEHGLAGLAFAGGIPGTVGGGVYMNAGAYGGELAQTVCRVRALTMGGEILDVAGDEMRFSYRHSRAMDEGWMILEAEFSLTPGDKEQIYAEMADYAARRRDKQPLQYPSAGSFFKRPAGHFAGALIEEAGLKGHAVGGAQVSEKHAGFLINTGGATAADFLGLMADVQSAVLERFGVRLEPEVRIV